MGNSQNYVEEVRAKLADLLPKCDPALLDLYTLLALQYGPAIDVVMVHNAWSVWQNRIDPAHRSLIPFPFLSPEVQALDEPYAEAIRRADREVYEGRLRQAAADRQHAGLGISCGPCAGPCRIDEPEANRG